MFSVLGKRRRARRSSNDRVVGGTDEVIDRGRWDFSPLQVRPDGGARHVGQHELRAAKSYAALARDAVGRWHIVSAEW